MKKNKLFIFCIIMIVVIVSGLLYVSYGYVVSKVSGNETAQSYEAISQVLKIEFDGGDEELVSNQEGYFIPGSTLTKTFSIKNVGTKDVNFRIEIDDFINKFVRTDDLEYKLYRDTNTLISEGSLNNSGDFTYADVNFDDTIDSEDVDLMAKYAAEVGSLNDLQLKLGDVDSDGNVNSADCTLSSRYISGLQISSSAIVGKTYSLDEAQVLANSISIAQGETIEFKLVINYLSSTENQIIDSGKVISGKLAFGDAVPTLGNKILSDSRIKKNETVPTFTVAETGEAGIYKTEDDYGTSWYFRGTQNYNYVNFAGFTWRIVRINGDGTIRIILNDITNFLLNNDSTGDTYYYGDENNGCYDTFCMAYDYDETSIKYKVDDFYENYLTDYSDFIADELFCNDMSVNSEKDDGENFQTIMNAGSRLSANPTLKCDEGNSASTSRYTVLETTIGDGVITNGKLTYPIGLLTADEAVMAGETGSYLSGSAYSWFTMTPNYMSGTYNTDSFSNMFSVLATGALESADISVYSSDRKLGLRPVINLRADVFIDDGTGEASNPYTIK